MDTYVINNIVQRIVAEYHPHKVILFGSSARGDGHPESDVDLLVVMPVSGSKRTLRLNIRRSLRDIPVPKDIVVSTPEEFSRRRNIVGTIEWPASHEGIELYSNG